MKFVINIDSNGNLIEEESLLSIFFVPNINISINNTIIVGRDTFDKYLKDNLLFNTDFIILTKNKNIEYQYHSKINYVYKKDTAIELAKSLKKQVYVVGGKSIFKLFKPECKEVLIRELLLS